MNKDQIKGRLKETGGKAKEVTGKALGKRGLELKGKAQQVAGQAQAKYGDFKNDQARKDKRPEDKGAPSKGK